MRYLALFLFCFLCLLKPVRGAEPQVVLVQKEMGEMRTLIESLHASIQELKTTVQSQNEVIREQTLRLNALEGKGPAAPSAVQPGGPLGLKGISQKWNPEIGAVGTVQAHLTEDGADGEGKDTIALKEFELSIAQYVDPYSRMDAILAFNDNLEDQNVDIEEAYYTRWGLPLGFSTQLGKFRSKIGKQNLQHLHALDTVDYPLVIQDFFGEEGLSSSGVRLQNMILNPWDVPVEMTGEVLRGNNGASFSGISRRPIFNTHLKTSYEINDVSDIELGGTLMFGDENPVIPDFDGEGNPIELTKDEGQDRYKAKVYGVDLTWNRQLSEGRKVKWQNELYKQNRSSSPHINKDPWGFYTLLDYRFSPRFSTGLRFDYVEPLDVTDEHGRTTGVSPYLTFWQSEFASFRLQYSHIERAAAAEKSDDGLYLQVNFLIGAHQHPVQ